MSRPRTRRVQAARPGQAMVEFALAATVFLTLVFGGIDVARAVFFNHDLNRAAEVVSRELVDSYSTLSPASFITQTIPVTGTQVLADAQHQSLAAMSTQPLQTTTCTTASASTFYTCLQWTNVTASSGGAGVTVCAVLDAKSSHVDMVQVTVTSRFKPVTGLFVGGKTLSFASTASALTADGEAAGSDPSGSGYTGICPALS